MDCSPTGSSVRGDSPGRIIGVGCHALLQGIFPTQRSNPGLPHCRRILYQLNHKGSLTIEFLKGILLQFCFVLFFKSFSPLGTVACALTGRKDSYHIMCYAQLFRCSTLCNPTDCNLPGSSLHGVFQAKILEWVAIAYYRGSSWPRDWTGISCVSCIGRWILYHQHHLGNS